MKVVILATAIGPMNRGIGQYERQLLPPFLSLAAAEGWRGTVILNRDGALPAPPVGFAYERLPIVRDLSPLRLAAEQLLVPLWTRGADVFLSMDGVFPIVPISANRKIVVTHDIHVIRHRRDPTAYPEDYSWRYKVWASSAHKKAIEAADRVVAVSHFTAAEIRELLGVPDQRVTVIPEGVDGERFHPIQKQSTLDEVRNRYDLPESYYLFVGPYSRKKNLRLIVEAYAVARHNRDVVLPVVVVGSTRRAPLYRATLRRIEQTDCADWFHFLGNVPDQDLPALYTMASAFIYPSLYEGFGLPPLEAMACGTPVVASNRTSIPEVTGDAALLIDPTDPLSLLEALQKIIDPAFRSALVDKGIKRAREFSWDRTASLLERALAS